MSKSFTEEELRHAFGNALIKVNKTEQNFITKELSILFSKKYLKLISQILKELGIWEERK